MTASDPKFLNGAQLKSFDDMIAESRERYLNGISDVLDAELERFVIPADRISLLQDAGPFLCFMVALKIAEAQTPAGTVMDKREALRAWWKLGKVIDKDVPAMLLDYGREAAARQLEGTGDAEAQG